MGAGTRLSDHRRPARKRAVPVSSGVPNTLGENREAVTEKLAPNLYSLHGSAGLDPTHPDAAGGRVAVLFGSDGVLMVDTEDPQLASKTLDTIRTFTSAPIKVVVNSIFTPTTPAVMHSSRNRGR